jgi:ABC-type lipoprotein release transport system permease subunit
VGANLLYKYLQLESSDMPTLKNVETGSVIRLNIDGISREVTVKGVIKTKVDLDQRVFMVDTQFRNLINRYDYNVGEIAVRLKPGTDANLIRDVILRSSDAGLYAKVQTALDAQPKFVNDMKKMFALLGNMIGSIGLAVAAITIFIVIFVNAITRRRYIGILKGIGISSWAIEFSYIIQSLFYAIVGMLLGSLIIFGFLEPFIRAHPIDFPFSDGILVVTVAGVLWRGAVLFIATIIAGYIPARIVVKQNTLNAILGR